MEEHQPEKKDKFSAFQAISVMVVIGIVVAVLLNNCSLPQTSQNSAQQDRTTETRSSEKSKAPPQLNKGWARIVEPGGIGFIEMGLLQRNIELANSGDEVARENHFEEWAAIGSATSLAAGQEVYIEDLLPKVGIAVVRKRGDTTKWYVPSKIVRQQ